MRWHDRVKSEYWVQPGGIWAMASKAWNVVTYLLFCQKVLPRLSEHGDHTAKQKNPGGPQDVLHRGPQIAKTTTSDPCVFNHEI